MSFFAPLNRFISRLDSDSPAQNSTLRRGPAGFQVLRNKSQDIPIEPWFDFIVGINGRQIDSPDPTLFSTEVHNCAGSAVALTLWNAKGQLVRDIHVPVPSPSPTIGLTLQWTLLSSTDDVWHVLDVIPNSPADLAGLLPYGDYIIGTPEGVVRGEAGLGELVEDYLSRPLRLYVYNHEYACTRLVTINPSRSWGGEGALGCVLGYGALHRLPPSLAEPPAAPGDTVFEMARFSNEEQKPRSSSPSRTQQYGGLPTGYSIGSPGLLVPASMTSPPPLMTTSSTTSTRPSRKQRNIGAAPNIAFDEYFKEGEEKSKEEDFAPKAKATLPPPPPKLGGPTKLPASPPSDGESRQTRSQDPIPDDEKEEEEEDHS